MNPHLLNIIVGLAFIVIFGTLSLLRREGLSFQFALEGLGVTAILGIISLGTGSALNPLFFLVVVYLLTMRSRLMVDLANLLSARGRQRDAIRLLQFTLRLFPDQNSRLLVLLNMGIVQLRRKNPKSAQTLLESVLEEANHGGLSMKSKAACHYNLGLALQRQGKKADAIRQFRKAIDEFPTSMYSKAAKRAIEKQQKPPSDSKETSETE